MNNILRMRLLPTLTNQTIGTYTNENLSGNVGIGAFGNGIVNRPFSLLHLDNGGTQYSGYRPWFRPGMTITNDSDLAWVGMKNEGYDINHLTFRHRRVTPTNISEPIADPALGRLNAYNLSTDSPFPA